MYLVPSFSTLEFWVVTSVRRHALVRHPGFGWLMVRLVPQPGGEPQNRPCLIMAPPSGMAAEPAHSPRIFEAAMARPHSTGMQQPRRLPATTARSHASPLAVPKFARCAFQREPGGSGRLDTPRGRGRPMGRSHCLGSRSRRYSFVICRSRAGTMSGDKPEHCPHGSSSPWWRSRSTSSAASPPRRPPGRCTRACKHAILSMVRVHAPCMCRPQPSRRPPPSA
eukprot:scaffold9730_cov63-Phaeocystis_antarctica.AAC.6